MGLTTFHENGLITTGISRLIKQISILTTSTGSLFVTASEFKRFYASFKLFFVKNVAFLTKDKCKTNYRFYFFTYMLLKPLQNLKTHPHVCLETFSSFLQRELGVSTLTRF